ncbi:17655_t:CDS:2 [Entrophospora sp. SA101]|nr:6510_t:CDS:2 [Entrophospora sp. SA101]CAJ0847493.1 17655_t:CDS:2 [Entrophospora sp. SA101]CAJ0860976.1 6582_t:CDS:2 [Entrophospora sp. SA101]CAJ0921482.1 6459_t:CDS:2 [Entrophospora sp. SA101]
MDSLTVHKVKPVDNDPATTSNSTNITMALNVSLTCSLQFPQKLIIQQLMQQPPPMRQPLIQRLPMQQAIGIPVINTGIVNPSQSIAATGDIDNMSRL